MEDGQDGVAGGDEGFLLGHSLDQPPVLGAEEGLGAGGADADFAEGGGQVGVAAAGGVASFALAAGLGDLGAPLGPGHQVGGGGKTVMSTPISAITSWALILPVPCTASICSIWGRYGSASTSIFAVSSSICAV